MKTSWLVVMVSLLRIFFHGPSLMTNPADQLVSNSENILLETPPRKGAVVHSVIAKLYSIMITVSDTHES
eukprot:359642-Chlamydomonas_euryale.AAC.3